MAKREFRAEFKIPPSQTAGCDEVGVIGSGKNTYVWIGKEGECVAHFSGPALLTKLVAAINEALNHGKKK